jgi:hypothetical protein
MENTQASVEETTMRDALQIHPSDRLRHLLAVHAVQRDVHSLELQNISVISEAADSPLAAA